jgi:predicted RNA-binding Zn-ribbon protein involved in translation (DUF1610 family)
MSATFGRQIGEKFLRVAIAVIGLLVLRLILSALPMLKSPVVYMPSATGVSLPGLQNSFTQDQIAAWQRAFADAMGQTLQGKLPEATADYLMQLHLAIFPLTIAYAIVDTLIFAMLILFGRDLSIIIRSNYFRFPDLGQILNFGILTIVVAAAYYSYQGILYPFLWPNHQDLYGWAFLVLGLGPLVGVVLLVSRNMDHITGAVMQSGSRALEGPVAIQCGSCGQPLVAGTKFCPSCGGAAIASPTATTSSGTRFCPSCGNQNPSGTKFCGGCGKPVGA